MNGIIHSYESFGASDGPGIRFVVFMQGCEMRCKYCHNPDTWCKTGSVKTPEDVMKQALRYRDYWGSNGGITVSGGEPMLQPQFVTELFTLAKENGVHTTLDTSGQPFAADNLEFEKLLKVTDLVLLDIKQIDSDKHKTLTGHYNDNILLFAKTLDKLNIPVWIRHVYIPEIETDEDLVNLGEFVKTLSNVEKFELLPYHTLGVHKWEKLGYDYSLKDVTIPTDEQITHAKQQIGRAHV